ncbi:TetR/AcrR family transcriptional regulator [Leptospira ognonensis]|uniref:TetR/AcrR family transcriptional regulator n=1 Tax=Leptospira ognonensis TaxID=2484945 RepID=A0A4V3JRY7_9LEPT|nr:TetR/AcrR family transcriptional regulator [Leptospira ognonensis]TGL62281.1 TetR/AcrR family transcriptional regulator [Leptospira ognonensis]
MSNKKSIRGAKQTSIIHKKIIHRKAPKQTRSIERFQKILEIAFQTIDEIGYENTTTDIIAERCEISVGSLYQFFPNKETIIYTKAEALYLELHELFFRKIKLLTQKYKRYSERLIQEILIAFEDTLSEVKGYSILHSILYTHPSLLALDQLSNERFAKSLAKELLMPLYPRVTKSKALLVARITVESVDAVYRSLVRSGEHSRRQKSKIMGELAIFLNAYFKTLT